MGDLDYDYSGASIAGSKNAAGLIHDRMASTRANAMPVYMGGIAGYVFEPNCTISDCTNSGEVNNDYYNNNIEYDGNASGKRANWAVSSGRSFPRAIPMSFPPASIRVR